MIRFVSIVTLLFVLGFSAQAQDFRVYPNPTAERVTLEVSSPNFELRLINLIGTEMYVTPDRISQGKWSVDLGHLPSGMYVLLLRKEDGTESSVRLRKVNR